MYLGKKTQINCKWKKLINEKGLLKLQTSIWFLKHHCLYFTLPNFWMNAFSKYFSIFINNWYLIGNNSVCMYMYVCVCVRACAHAYRTLLWWIHPSMQDCYQIWYQGYKSMSEIIEIKTKFALACYISFGSITFEDLGKTFLNQYQEWGLDKHIYRRKKISF